jgi:predicted membrane protein
MDDEHKFEGRKFADDLGERIHQQANSGIFSGNPHAGRLIGILPGLILAAIGTIFLLDHMGILRAESLWKYWPLLIIAAGLIKLFNQRDRVLGIGFILVGLLLPLHKLGRVGLSWEIVWPMLLIFAGLIIIWKKFETPAIPGVQGSLSSGGRDTVNEYAMFGGVERRVTIQNFRGGNVTAVFGGVELDFCSAEIEGDEAILLVEAMFGGIEIKVPERWNVSFEVQSIFAGYSDETRPQLPDPVGGVARKTLVIQGRAVFGGISVKN